MKIAAYGLLGLSSLKESLIYWKNALAQVFFELFRIAIQISAWYALYSSMNFEPMMGRSFDTMMTYQMVVLIVGGITFAGKIASLLEERIKSGEITTDFLRPIDPRGILISKSWGEKIFFLFPQVLAVGVGIWVLGGIQLPSSLTDFWLFLLSLVFAYLINLTFELLISTFAFWFVAVGTLQWFIDFFQLAISGAVVPLWLLPDWLQTFARMLPFQASVYIPMQIYLGEIGTEELLANFALQIFWIIALFLLHQYLWKKGIKKLVVHGG